MKFLVCSRLSEHRYKTPEGYLVCVDSILSRTGKQTYSRDELFGDGCRDEVEVDRSAEEVFSEKTLASFENKPLTIEHPEEDVTPANHSKYSVGFIRDVKRGKDGSDDVMLGTIVVTDAEAIELIESGKLKELSCGYDCDIEDDDNPQQRNIRGNHVALCERGRAGIARIIDSVKDSFDIELDLGFRKITESYSSRKEADDRYDELIRLSKKPSMRGMKLRKLYDALHDEKKYVVYASGTWLNYRALFAKHQGPAAYTTEANAEQFTEAEALRRINSTKGKYKWEMKKVKDMKVSHDNIREQPVFVMQSDVDKNLFFYIGKTHAMKEGEYTYAQYDMEGMTPDELRKELEANGWHKVARGPAPFIDEDPYKESTEGLEEAEKNLHDEMICNTETDCNDELQTFRIGFGSGGRYDDEPGLDISVDVKAADVKSAIEKAKQWAKTHNYDDAWSFREVKTKGDRHFQIDACKDADKYHVGQTVLYKGKKVKISKVEYDDRYGYDLLIPNPDYDGSDSRYEFIWVGEDVKTIDACKDAQMSNLGDKVRFRNRVYVIVKVQRGKTDDVARLTLRPLERFDEKDKPFEGGGDSYWDIHIERWQLDDSVKDAKTEYIFNYRDTYHGTQDKMRVDANNLDEAIREFGKTMALGGFGTANIYVVSVSPNDGYMRAYGKLSEMLKQKWTRDSVKKLDSKKLLSIVKVAKSVKTSDMPVLGTIKQSSHIPPFIGYASRALKGDDAVMNQLTNELRNLIDDLRYDIDKVLPKFKDELAKNYARVRQLSDLLFKKYRLREASDFMTLYDNNLK